MGIQQHISARRPGVYALAIAGLYALLAGIWIAFSDQWVVLYAEDAAEVSRLQTLKGFAFVTVTAALLFGFAYWMGASLLRMNHLAQWAHRDPLTGLASRHELNQILTQLLDHRRKTGAQLAVISVDVYRLRHINESFGVTACDGALIQLAHRLRETCGPHVTLARIHGGQFVAVIAPPCDKSHAIDWAQRLLACSHEPVQLGGRPIRMRLDAGISIAPEDGDSPKTLLEHAHTAVFQAKQAESASVGLAADLRRAPVIRRLSLETDLADALDQDQFHLVYQPIVRSEDGYIQGCEALLRWHHPDMGRIPPNQFIPMLEQSGQIVEVGHWVIDQALSQLAAWQNGDDFSLAINLSRRQLWNEGLDTNLAAACSRHGVAPGSLCLEITETLAMQDPIETRHILAELQDAGYQLAMDDFGSGYSCLAYLKEYPLDLLKIDRAFVAGVPKDQANTDMLAIIINMARQFQLKTIAEGVETGDEARTLIDLGCDYLQGYWLAHPLSADGFQGVMTRYEGYMPTESRFRQSFKVSHAESGHH